MTISVEAEQSVLGSLLLDNSALDRISWIKPEHFSQQGHRTIFVAIKNLITAGESADVITVHEALTDPALIGGLPYLNDLNINTPSAANIQHYANILLDKALRRALISETGKIAEMAVHSTKTPASQLLDHAQAAICRLAETRVEKEPVKASVAMVSHIDVMNDRTERKVFGIPTGFEDIDDLLSGGMNRGNMVIIGARPSMGKTALALNISTNQARDYSVLFLSQEMSTGELLDRVPAALGGIPLGNIVRGDLQEDQWSRYTSALAKLNDLNLYIDDQGGLTLLDVRAKARAVKRKHGLDIMVVDYLQLMSGDGDNRNQQIEEISRGLKALAKELNIVVIALSQLSRNAANKSRPQLSDLRDSGAIEQDADIVIFIHREEVDRPETHMRGFADVFIAKNRQGRIDDVLLRYAGDYTRFESTSQNRPQPPKTARKRGLAEHL